MYPLVHGDIKVFETGDESLSMDLFDTYGIMFIKVLEQSREEDEEQPIKRRRSRSRSRSRTREDDEDEEEDDYCELIDDN